MLSDSQKIIFLQIKDQNKFLVIKNEFPTNNKMLSECALSLNDYFIDSQI